MQESPECRAEAEAWIESHVLGGTNEEQLQILLDRLGSDTMCFYNEQIAQEASSRLLHPCVDTILGHIVKHELWEVRWYGSDGFGDFISHIMEVFICKHLRNLPLSVSVTTFVNWRY